MIKNDKDAKRKISEVIQEHGYEKAVRELCKAGLAASHAEARRYVRYEKIQNGDKTVRHS